MSLVLLTLVVGGVLAAFGVGAKAAAGHRSQAGIEVATHNAIDALRDAPYIRCATAVSYRAVIATAVTADLQAEVVAVEQRTSDGGWAARSGCEDAPDGGVQRVSLRIQSSSNLTRARSLVVVKSDPGTFPGIDGFTAETPVGGATRCTITGSAVDDTWVDEAAPSADHGGATAVQLRGDAGHRNEALLRFDLRAGTPCSGVGEQGTLPGGHLLKSAALELTFSAVDGSPGCPTRCAHVLERIDPDSTWTEDGATWSNRPTSNGENATTFNHGTGTSARIISIGGADLRNDVRTFYRQPELNNGWIIRRAIDNAATFKFQSGETASEPRLVLVLAPATGTDRQLRNVGFDECAAVKDDGRAIASPVWSMPCDGGGSQSYVYDASSRQLTAVNSGLCVAAGATGPKVPVAIAACSPVVGQQWSVVGETLRDGTGRCLELLDGVASYGTNLFANVTCTPSSKAQRWALEPRQAALPASAVPVRVRNKLYDNCLDTYHGLVNSLAAVSSGTDGSVVDGDVTITYDEIISNDALRDSLLRDGRRLESFPCMNGGRPSQSWLRSGSLHLSNSVTIAGCLGDDLRLLDSNGQIIGVKPVAAGSTTRLHDCRTVSWQQWDRHYGSARDMVRNLHLGLCLRGTADMGEPTLAGCDPADAAQHWIEEQLDDPLQLRNVGSGRCAEPDSATAVSSDVRLVSWPCRGGSRIQQQLVMLGNGQIHRNLSDHCLSLVATTDATFAGSSLGWVPCPGSGASAMSTARSTFFHVPDASGQGQLQVKNTQGTKFCVQGGADAERLTVVPCAAGISSLLWRWDLYGDAPIDPSGQLRNAASQGCAEPSNLVTDSYATFATWPCVGGERTQQKLVRLTNGQIRRDGPNVTGVSARCLVADDVDADLSGSTVRWDWCSSAMSNAGWRARSTWTFVTSSGPSQVRIRSTSGAEFCLQGGADTQELRLQACSATPAQTWVWEPFGAPASLAAPAGQLRAVSLQGCAEPSNTVTDSYADFVSWPCVGGDRVQQRLVILNNGQIRRDSLDVTGADARCLVVDRLNPDFTGSTVRWDWCSTASSTADWRARSTWMREAGPGADGRIRVTNNAGAAFCLQGASGGDKLTMQVCSSGAAQVWRFELFGPAPAAPSGQFRSDASDGCLEPEDLNTDSYAKFASWPCAGAERVQQRLIMLSNGQIRRDSPDVTGADARCLVVDKLDPAFTGSTARWDWCSNASSTGDWRSRSTWTYAPDADGHGQVRATNSAGSSFCLQSGADSERPTLQPCGASAAQLWRWQAFGTAPSDPSGQLRNGSSGGCAEPLDTVTDSYADFVTWPCMGITRPQQQLVMLDNGQIRRRSPDLTGPDARCLVVNNANPAFTGSTVRWDWCSTAISTTDWRARSTWSYAPDSTGQGRLQVKNNAGASFCLQGALDSEKATLQTCGASAAQQWRWEPFGSGPPNPLDQARKGQLRSVGSAGCAEPQDTVTDSYATFATWPCVGGTRLQQRLVMLNNGQVRRESAAATGVDARCLVVNNANPGFAGSTVRWDWCSTANSSADWRTRSTWTYVASTSGQGQMQVRNNVGASFCLQSSTDSEKLTLQLCSSSNANQQWSWQAFGTLPANPVGQFRRASSDACAEPLDTMAASTASFVTWPCVGGSREQQRLVLLGNGQIRRDGPDVLGAEARCLVVNNLNPTFTGSTVRWEACSTAVLDGNWRARSTWTHAPDASGQGQLRVTNTLAATSCLQSGLAGRTLTLQTCGSAVEQLWRFEPFGTSPANPFGQFRKGQMRNGGSDGCAEPDQPTSVATDVRFITWRCVGGQRNQQELLMLNNGQIRRTFSNDCMLVANLTDGTFSGSALRWDTCPSTTADAMTSARSSWILAVGSGVQGQLQVKNTVGATFCVAGGLDAEKLVLQTCGSSAPQLWSWEAFGAAPVAPPPTGQLRSSGLGGCAEPQDADATSTATFAMWPCVGGVRSQQRLVMLNNGQIRRESPYAAGTEARCLAVNNLNPGFTGSSVRWETCSTAMSSTDWRARTTWTVTVDAAGQGPAQVKNSSGATFCLQGALDGEKLSVQTCTSSSAQQWRWQPFGTGAASPTGQLRNVGLAGCAEPSQVTTDSYADFVSWPCVGAARPQQRLVMLSNGQIRRDSPDVLGIDSRCLVVDNVNPGFTASKVRWDLCSTATSTGDWRARSTWTFVRDGSGQGPLQVKNNVGTNFCLQGTGDTERLTVQSCTSALTQQWRWQELGTDSVDPTGQLRSIGRSACAEPEDLGDLASFVSWPCSGMSRPQQRLTLLGNGQIRRTGDEAIGAGARCLVVNNANPGFGGSSLRWDSCSTASSTSDWRARSTWTYEPLASGDGQLRVKNDVGATFCVQAGPVTTGLTVQSCAGSNADQAWSWEPIAAAESPLRLLHGVAAGNCAEVVDPGDVYSSLQSWSCGDEYRPQQRLAILSNGQIRTHLGTTAGEWCLYQPSATFRGTVRSEYCWYAAGAAVAARSTWLIGAPDVAGRRTIRLVNPADGTSYCLTGGDDGALASTTACTGSSDQLWVLDPVTS